MPQSKSWEKIGVRKEIKQKLEHIYEERKHELLERHITSVAGLVNDVLLDFIESSESFSAYAPYLSNVVPSEDRFSMQDAKLKQAVDVYVRDKEIKCAYDESNDCFHVRFLWSLPVIYLKLKDRGFKPLRI